MMRPLLLEPALAPRPPRALAHLPRWVLLASLVCPLAFVNAAPPHKTPPGQAKSEAAKQSAPGQQKDPAVCQVLSESMQTGHGSEKRSDAAKTALVQACDRAKKDWKLADAKRKPDPKRTFPPVPAFDGAVMPSFPPPVTAQTDR